MRIGIIGIGGVGGFYGGKLARQFPPGSEHDVLFLCRGAHKEAIRHNGLRVITREDEFVSHPLLATDSPAEMGSLDVVLFCVKGYDLASTAAAMMPAVREDTVLIPLGNGVNNDEVVSQSLAKGDCINGCVYISTHIEAPGIVEQTGGNCKLLFGSTDGIMEPYRSLEMLFRQAGIDATLSPTIVKDVWMKFAFIGPVSGVTSLHGCAVGEALAESRWRTELEAMMAEVAALAEAKDVG
ncbi:MAG: ketopantoate reductase family protein, partial [Chloroflexota bacterium]